MSLQSFFVVVRAKAGTVIVGGQVGHSRRVTRHITFEVDLASSSLTDSCLSFDSAKGLPRRLVIKRTLTLIRGFVVCHRV